MKKLKYRKSVFVVVYRKIFVKGKEKILYLLLRRKMRWKGWEFPKGGVEKGEKFIETVQRELKEETGQKAFSIKKHNFSGKYKFNKAHPFFPGFIGQEFKLFSAELRNPKVKVDKNEHSSYKWLPYSDALKIIDFVEKKKSLKKVNKELKK